MINATPTLGSKHKQPKSRGRSSAELTTARYRRIRHSKLVDSNFCCVRCLDEGRMVLAVEVHHIKPRETHPHLVHDIDNLMPLCREHHEQQHGPTEYGGG